MSALPTPPDRRLALYAAISRLPLPSYRSKIMGMAFIGTHIPLIAIGIWLVSGSTAAFAELIAVFAVALVATLLGTIFTLLVLDRLLQPVLLTADALRGYRQDRTAPSLPMSFTDEAGQLMANARRTIEQLDATLEQLEFVDEGTGLPNRKRFEQLVASHRGSSKSFAVALVRFVGHSQLYETLGHAAADEAMRELARRLRENTSCGIHLSRVEPGAFSCLFDLPEGTASPWSATQALRGLIDASSGGLLVSGIAVRPSLVAGLSLCPQDSDSPAELLDHALAAASAASESAPLMLHSSDARQIARDRFRLEYELRRALDRDEFELHYQPVVEAASRSTVGAEALIRWRHPERGLLMPGAFISVAESSGLIDPMGLWVLRRVCAQLKEWHEAKHPAASLRVAINLSARQFRDPELSRVVLAAIDEFGISPDRLELELTETAAMMDHDHTRKMFMMLRDAGVSIAIDDFGTGYSSLSYLRRLPFDKLKIDREFVSGVDHTPHSQAICSAMIALGRGLSLDVLAEGIENEREARFLGEQGCQLFQGYRFSRPLPVRDFESTLDRRYDRDPDPPSLVH